MCRFICTIALRTPLPNKWHREIAGGKKITEVVCVLVFWCVMSDIALALAGTRNQHIEGNDI
jgi:hypothetical protein